MRYFHPAPRLLAHSFAIAVVLIAALIAANAALAATTSSTYTLQISRSSSRTSPVALSGATLSGSAYVFLTPTSGVSKASFWLDNPAMSGTATHVEGSAPLDFVGTTTTGTAKPWDTTKVANGSHSISVQVVTSSATYAVTATFTVANGTTVPSPSPTATPKPTVSPTPVPTTSATPKPSASATTTPAPTATPKPSASATPTPTATPKPTVSPTPTPAPTATPTPTPTPTPAPTSTSTGFLTRSGTQLMLGGKPFVFTGFNIYQANSRSNCSYTMGTGTALDTALSGVGSGAEVFRAWFFQRLATTNGVRDWTAFDHTLAVAKAHGMKVVATLGNQWGSCESPTSVYKTQAWYEGGYKTDVLPENTVAYRQWVQEVVSRYKNDPTIAMWQLMNEAEVKASSGSSTCGPAADLYNFTSDVASLVKSIDPNHLVSLGTMGGGQCGTQGSDYQHVHSVPAVDVCEFHDYNHATTALPSNLSNDIAACNALNKPIFVGEAGIQPPQVDGTLAGRASAFDAKICAQFTAGVRGFLVWSWNNSGSDMTSWPVGPGDPTIGVIDKH